MDVLVKAVRASTVLRTIFLTFRNFGLVLLALPALPGCAGQDLPATSNYRQGVLHSKQLVAQYGQLENPFVRDYFGYLTGRLLDALRRHKPQADGFQVVLLATDQPMGFSAGGGFILVSRGLLLSLSSEAELAFIVGHEVAHQQLGHLDDLSSVDELGPGAELAADRFAVSLMALAGYDPRLALQALRNAYGVKSSWGHFGRYPQLDDRLVAIRSQLSKSDWQPPGTVNRRDFVMLQRLLTLSERSVDELQAK